jgi:hypothetical protein
MKIFYCYSIPVKEFLKDNNIFPLNDEPKINPSSNKNYWEFIKGQELDNALNVWKQNKIKAINYIKNIK